MICVSYSFCGSKCEFSTQSPYETCCVRNKMLKNYTNKQYTYLCFQIGFNIPLEIMIALVIALEIMIAKVDTLEFEKTLISGVHHSGKPGITCNNMVKPIMLHNLQGKYTPDSMNCT